VFTSASHIIGMDIGWAFLAVPEVALGANRPGLSKFSVPRVLPSTRPWQPVTRQTGLGPNLCHDTPQRLAPGCTNHPIELDRGTQGLEGLALAVPCDSSSPLPHQLYVGCVVCSEVGLSTSSPSPTHTRARTISVAFSDSGTPPHPYNGMPNGFPPLCIHLAPHPLRLGARVRPDYRTHRVSPPLLCHL
jgi:hypothetical protein